MFPLKLGSELKNLVKRFLSTMKIQTKYRPNFHQVENFHEVKCTPPPQLIIKFSVKNIFVYKFFL